MVAKYVTAFLNTGFGGTVFFGVHDTGVVSGMKFPKHGKAPHFKDEDHFRMAVQKTLHPRDILGPPIQDHCLYELNFEVIVEDPSCC